MNAQNLRHALGRFTTGVTIVTCLDPQGQPVGVTVNSFNSLSLQPPLVLWSLRLASSSLPAFRVAGHHAIHVLSEAQLGLSRRFAGPAADKFALGDWSIGERGVPLLAGCAAVFECESHAQHELGDHLLFIGRVLACSASALPPLVYQSGHYHLLGDVV